MLISVKRGDLRAREEELGGKSVERMAVSETLGKLYRRNGGASAFQVVFLQVLNAIGQGWCAKVIKRIYLFAAGQRSAELSIAPVGESTYVYHVSREIPFRSS